MTTVKKRSTSKQPSQVNVGSKKVKTALKDAEARVALKRAAEATVRYFERTELADKIYANRPFRHDNRLWETNRPCAGACLCDRPELDWHAVLSHRMAYAKARFAFALERDLAPRAAIPGR